MRRLFLTAMLLILGGTMLTTGALPGHAAPTESTSCNSVGDIGFDSCVTTPTEACVSDRGSCPFPLPLCYYNGQNPTPVNQLSCFENEPPPHEKETYQRGVCIYDTTAQLLCVGGDNQNPEGPDRWCPWVNIVLEDTGLQCEGY